MSKRKKALIIISAVIAVALIITAAFLMKPEPISQELKKLDNSKPTIVIDFESEMPFQFVSETAKIGKDEFCVYSSVSTLDCFELAVYKKSGILNNKYDLCTSSIVWPNDSLSIAEDYDNADWLCWDVREGSESLEYLREGIEALKLIDFKDGEIIANNDEEVFEDQREYLGSVYCGAVPDDCVSVTVNGKEAQIQKVSFEIDGKQIEFNLFYLMIEEQYTDDIEIVGVDENGDTHQIRESQNDDLTVTQIN